MNVSALEAKNSLFYLQEVSLEIENSPILLDVTVEVSKKGITGIIGPSGAGKSTLLRLMNKLLVPSKGSIFFQGTKLSQLPTRKFRKQVGFVQQKPYLFEGTVRANLEYGPKIWGIDYSKTELKELLTDVALSPSFLDRNVSNLSIGEQQRVSLARTLANNPSTLLLDEPTSSLDVASEELIEETLQKLRRERIKIIIVTHSLPQTRRLTDQVIFLKNGRVQEKTSTTKFFDKHTTENVRNIFQTKRG